MAAGEENRVTDTRPRPVHLRHYLAYGCNDVLGAGSMAVISGWVLIFYTQFCGLSAGQAALIFAVARILDAFASPIIGFVSDHFGATALGRRFGRRRFFVLAAIPLMPSFALMWLPGQEFWFYLVSYVLFELIYAMEIIPFETLAAEMSTDYRTKAKFAGSRILFGQASAILAGFLPLWLITALGRDNADTFFYMGCIFAVLFMATAFILWAFSWERFVPGSPEALAAARSSGASSVAEAFRALYRNLFSTLRIRAFRLHLGIYLGGYIAQDVFNAAFTFFVMFALAGSTAIASGLLGTMYIVQLFAVMLAINASLRTLPARAYQAAAACFAIGTLALLGLWAAGLSASSWWIWVPIALAGLGRGAINYIPWATYNYMADVDELVTGRRREGAFAGVMTFIRKAAQAAAVAGVGWLMQMGGFVSGAPVQTSGAIHTIAWVLGLGTVSMLGFGVLVSFRFRLGPVTHEILMGEIERLRAGERMPSSPAAQAVVEDLSGWRYDQLWGANTVATGRS